MRIKISNAGMFVAKKKDRKFETKEIHISGLFDFSALLPEIHISYFRKKYGNMKKKIKFPVFAYTIN